MRSVGSPSCYDIYWNPVPWSLTDGKEFLAAPFSLDFLRNLSMFADNCFHRYLFVVYQVGTYCWKEWCRVTVSYWKPLPHSQLNSTNWTWHCIRWTICLNLAAEWCAGLALRCRRLISERVTGGWMHYWTGCLYWCAYNRCFKLWLRRFLSQHTTWGD